MAEETYELSEAFMEVPVPQKKPMGEYSIPKQYKNIPLTEIYSKKLGREKFEKLVDVIKWQETKNRHYKKNGIVKIGEAGEVGLMQIKPLGDLGGGLKGIRRPVLEDEDLNERVGRVHLINILKNKNINYDMPSAIMAWNRGLTEHRKWTDQGRNKDKLPSITKRYLVALEKAFPEVSGPDNTEESFVKKPENVILSPPPASIVEQTSDSTQEYPYELVFPELFNRKFLEENNLNPEVLKDIARNSFKNSNSFYKARESFLKQVLNNPDIRKFMNRAISGESIKLPKIGKKEGGLIQKYQKGDLVGPSTEPKTGFFNVSGGYSEKKRKPVGKINKNTPVVRGSEQKGISMQLQLPRAITDKIIKGLRLGGEYSKEEFIQKLSASNFFNEKMKTEIKKSGITVGKDKFDISLNKTSFKPEGQKSKNQYDAYGRFTVDKSPLGEITVNLNVEDFTGKRPQYGVSLRKEIKFKEGGFVSA